MPNFNEQENLEKDSFPEVFVKIETPSEWVDETGLVSNPEDAEQTLFAEPIATAPIKIRKRGRPKKSTSLAKLDPAALTDLFCALCLRECAADQLVKFSNDQNWNCFNAFECKEKLENILSIQLELETCAVCHTCWKMIEMLADFKACCVKARNCAKRYMGGLAYEEKTDSWLCSGTTEMIDRMHKAIQGHTEHIESKKTSARSRERKKIVESTGVTSQLEGNVQDQLKLGFALGSDQQSLESNAMLESMLVEKLDIKIEVCEKCGRRFDSKTGYLIHLQRCTAAGQTSDQVLHTCSICSATFTEPQMLKFHLNKHKGIKPYQCRKECGKRFYSPSARLGHERCCGAESCICPLCGIQLKHHATLRHHLTALHGDANIGCETCGRMFKSKKALYKHQLVHSDARKYPCAICGKAFKSSYAARVHLRIHTQEKPFACSICDQAFAYKCLLKAHVERMHGAPSD